MVILIAEAILKTLTEYVVKKQLDKWDEIKIDGAPSWYMQPVENQMCVFAMKNGGLDSIEVAKEKAKFKMIKKIDKTIDIVIYDNLSNVKDKKEQKVIELFKKDPNLSVFVDKNIRYSKISYEEEVDKTFVRACILDNTIINYQKQRLSLIKKEVVKQRVSNAMDELDKELMNMKD